MTNLDTEVASLTIKIQDISVGHNFYVGVLTGLDQFGRYCAHGAVVGWKSLVQLCHFSPNRRCCFYQIDLETLVCQIQGSLHACDAASHDHDSANRLYILVFGIDCGHCVPSSAGSIISPGFGISRELSLIDQRLPRKPVASSTCSLATSEVSKTSRVL